MVQAPSRPEGSVESVGDYDLLATPLELKLPDCWDPTDEALIELGRLNEPWRFELTAQRELVIMSPEGRGSSRRGAEILIDIGNWNRQSGDGFVLGPQAGVRLPDTSMREPDVAWMSAERWDLQDEDKDESLAQSCPELVVEIVSVTDVQEKQRQKMEQWIKNGALLGWLIDPFEDVVVIYRPETEPEQLDKPNRLSGENVCEGLEVNLERVWKQQ